MANGIPLPKFPIETGHPPALSESHAEVCAHDNGTPGRRTQLTNARGFTLVELVIDLLAPLMRFTTSFLLVFLLAIWIVLLLRLIQIRRNLVPLAKLQQATRRISLAQFQTRVTITSGDEFEELASSFNSIAEQN
jgi:signal transduction histidine kinase